MSNWALWVRLFTQQTVHVPVSYIKLIASLTSNKVKYKNLGTHTFPPVPADKSLLLTWEQCNECVKNSQCEDRTAMITGMMRVLQNTSFIIPKRVHISLRELLQGKISACWNHMDSQAAWDSSSKSRTFVTEGRTSSSPFLGISWKASWAMIAE